MATVRQPLEIPPVMRTKLYDVRQRERNVQLAAGLLSTLTVFLVAMMSAMLADWLFTLFSPGVRTALTTAAIGVGTVLLIAWVVWPLLRLRRIAEVAQHVDRAVPGLQERWSTVTEISSSPDRPEMLGSPAMLGRVSQEAESMQTLVNPVRVVSTIVVKRRLYALAGALALLLLAFLVDVGQTWVLMQRFWAPRAQISLTKVVAVTGDAVVARNEPLAVRARLENRLRDSATLTLRSDDGSVESLAMRPASDGSAEFTHEIKSVAESFAYRIRSGDGQSPWQKVTAADRPYLRSVLFRIIPPAYARIPVLEEAGLPSRAKALEGSRLELMLRANEPLGQMQLELGKDEFVALQPDDDGETYRFERVLDESITLSPVLTNTYGLQNERAPKCTIIVYRDRPPTVKVVSPDDEIAVRPDDKVTIQFSAKDDFGLAKAELAVFKGAVYDESNVLKAIDIPLGEQQGQTSAEGKVDLDLNEFELEHGSQLSYVVRVFDTKQSVATAAPAERDAHASQTQAANASDQSAGGTQDARGAQREQAAGGDAKRAGDTDEQRRQDEETESQDLQVAENDGSDAGASSSSRNPPAPPPKQADEQQRGGELTGAPRPEDEMARRVLDVGGQCTSCKPMRIHIDEWAGSFEGQAREKLQLAIDPYLQQLDELLAAAQEVTAQMVKHAESTRRWKGEQKRSVQAADDRLASAEQVIMKLRDTSAGTPYAFIGLQLVEIGQSHVAPARDHLESAAPERATARLDDLTTAHYHIERAREMLARLTREYEAVKLQEKLAEEMLRIKKMHQVFIEGTFALLGSKKPSLNPKERSFVELEFDEEFRRKLRELLERKRDIQAELAKILAEDPRLLARFMAVTRLEADSLRDQLTLLARRQRELHDEVGAWQAPSAEPAAAENQAEQDIGESESESETESTDASQDDAPNAASEKDAPPVERDARSEVLAAIGSRRNREAVEIAEAAAQMYDNFVTWTPLDLDSSEGTLGGLREGASQVATAAGQFAVDAAGNQDQPALERAENLYGKLKRFERDLPEAHIDGHEKLAVHIANRLIETSRLITRTSGWIRKVQKVESGEYHLAAEVDQHGVTVDTAELNGKLENLEAWLAGMPEEVVELAGALQRTLNDKLVVEQLAAETALNQNELPRAFERQQNAVEHFAAAETQFDELIDRIIEHLDSQPVGKPSLDGVQAASLEELLAMLQDEAKACERLGIPCCRPTNLQIVGDWLLPGRPAGGMGMMIGGGQAQSMLAQQRADRLRADALQAMRRLAAESGAIDDGRSARRWNTLASQLEDALRQGRGNIPPKEYRRAIEQYFESLAEELRGQDQQRRAK